MSVIGIIPARYASSRFPGKPLALIAGKTMLARVVEQARKASLLEEVVVATDDERIVAHANQLGVKVVMTSNEHPSGTDRCYEAYKISGSKADYVLNVQGDEPFLNPIQIDELAAVCTGNTEIATQMIVCNDPEVLMDQGEVKIALGVNNQALYFSRNIIPAIKNKPMQEWHLHHTYYRHVGMYAYRKDILEKICALKPSALEKAESLEQLRWLENGYTVTCVPTTFDSHCVDTPEDIEKVLRLMSL